MKQFVRARIEGKKDVVEIVEQTPQVLERVLELPFRLTPRLAIRCLLQCALDSGHQAPEPVLQDVVRGPTNQAFNRHFFSNSPGNKNKRNFGYALLCQFQSLLTVV